MEKRQKEMGSEDKGAQTRINKPHFELEPGRLTKLHDQVSALKLGEMRGDVTAMVGPSDHEELLGPKKGRDWNCRGLVYYIEMFDETPGNVKDRRVELVFNRQDRLIAILSNVDEIMDRGDISLCR